MSYTTKGVSISEDGHGFHTTCMCTIVSEMCTANTVRSTVYSLQNTRRAVDHVRSTSYGIQCAGTVSGVQYKIVNPGE